MSLEDKFSEAGLPPRDVQLLIALAKYRNNGGTENRALAMVERAFQMPDKDHTQRAAGHRGRVQVRQSNGDGKDQVDDADKAARSVSPSPIHRGGTDYVAFSDKASKRMSRPVREPTKAALTAAKEIAKASAKVVLDLGWIGKDAIPGGPRYIDLRVRDLMGMAKRQFAEGATHGRAAYACMLILWELEKLGTADQDSKWVDVLPPETVRRIAHLTEADSLKPMVIGVLESFNPVLRQMIGEAGHA